MALTKKTVKNITTESTITKTNQSENTLQTKEINGPKGLEPTRYGDWEKKGRCIDF